jgi:hypothetical protein
MVHHDCGDRLVFYGHGGDSGANQTPSGVPMHANSVRPSDARRHVVRHCVGDESDRRDASAYFQKYQYLFHRLGEVLLHDHVGQNALSYGYGDYVF